MTTDGIWPVIKLKNNNYHPVEETVVETQQLPPCRRNSGRNTTITTLSKKQW